MKKINDAYLKRGMSKQAEKAYKNGLLRSGEMVNLIRKKLGIKIIAKNLDGMLGKEWHHVGINANKAFFYDADETLAKVKKLLKTKN